VKPERVWDTDAARDGYYYMEGIHGFTSHTGGNCGPYSWWKADHDRKFYSWSLFADSFHCVGGLAVVDDFGELVKVTG
jgi:hypothetical protein